jgi:hypothetical protein
MAGNLTEVPTTNLRYVAFQKYILPGRNAKSVSQMQSVSVVQQGSSIPASPVVQDGPAPPALPPVIKTAAVRSAPQAQFLAAGPGEVRTDRLAHRISQAADRQAKRIGGQISRAREESRSSSPLHEKHSPIHRVHDSFLSDRKNYSTHRNTACRRRRQ